jgi:uncharacterized protein (TIGR02246 family)
MHDDVDSIRGRWVAALNSGSAEGFVRCVTPEALWLPPRGDAIQGRHALIAWLEPLFQRFRYEFSVSAVRLRPLGDWAVEEADFRTVLHPKHAGDEVPPVHIGRYLMIWHRLPAGWLIDRYVDRTGS